MLDSLNDQERLVMMAAIDRVSPSGSGQSPASSAEITRARLAYGLGSEGAGNPNQPPRAPDVPTREVSVGPRPASPAPTAPAPLTMPMPGNEVFLHRGVFDEAEAGKFMGLAQGKPNYVTVETANGERLDIPASRVNYRGKPVSRIMEGTR